jgi:HK97 family phage major capsid protein
LRVETGGTVAQITTDVKALFAAALTAGISFANGVWVMHPRTALYLSLVLTTGGARMWPEVNVRGGTWLGLPVITSAAVPVDSGSATSIVLLEASEVFMAEGTVLLDVSRSASLQMEDAPGTGAQSHVSLWQNNLLGIKAVRYLNYIRRQDAGVAVLTGVAF